MRKSYFFYGLLPLAAGCLLTGCVDDGYDVSNIDTTSQINVNNLTVPLNLEAIKIDKVIDLEDNDNISIVDGAYAIEKRGEISTSDFRINPIHVNVAPIARNAIKISNIPTAVVPSDWTGPFPLPAQESSYDMSMRDIDKSLKALDEIKTQNPMRIDVVLSIDKSIANSLNCIRFENLRIQLPKNLVDVSNNLGFYDSATGILDLGLQYMYGGRLDISMTAEGLAIDSPIEDRTLPIEGEVGVLSETSLYLQPAGGTLPSEIEIGVDYTIGNFDVASFSGSVNYEMDDVTVNPISLSDLPEFLDSPETRLYLANPTIDINIFNPVGGYGLSGKGVLSLSSKFSSSNDSEANGALELSDASYTQDINFNTSNMSGLGSILVNENVGGLPKSINISVNDLVFFGDVKDFPVGSDIPGASGDYSFTAPLGFGEGSTVVYEKIEDGWYSDDLAGLNIKTINLTAKCMTDLPVGLQLQVYPIGRDGNVIPVDENSNLFKVNANSDSKDVVLSIKARNDATIKDLDGIRFIATVSQNKDVNGSDNALRPDQIIVLDNLRITVDGFYVKEF